MELVGDRTAAIQAAIAGQDFLTSTHGESTDQNIDHAGLNALVSALVVKARRVLVIGAVDRLVEV